MFTTYSASAGSGKTTHLVADYIALCFKFDAAARAAASGNASSFHLDSYRRILAITFTNAATAEMKDRIVRTLKAFAFNDYKNLGGSEKAIYNIIVKKLFSEKHDRAAVSFFMQQESLELLRRLIFDYARFSVSTIDSFNQRTIHSSALSMDLNLNYSVQLDLYEFYQLAIDQMLNTLQAGSDLSDRILYLIDNEMEDAGKANIDGKLQDSLKVLYGNAEENYRFLKTLYATDSKDLREKLSQMKEKLHADLEDIKTKIRPEAGKGNCHIATIKNTGSKFSKPKIEKWFDNRIKDPFGESDLIVPECFKNDKGSYFKKSKEKLSAKDQGTADNEILEVEKCMANIRAVLESDESRAYRDNLIRCKKGTTMLMLKDLKEKMDEIKNQRNFFILSEANTLLCEKIEELGFETIFDRVKYENFFIDEFQDTSAMQWGNLKPLLINNALASGHDVSLFGDVKQAIYRFRGGDSKLFYNLIDETRFNNDKDLSAVVDHEHYNSINLGTNFRSLHTIVEFNNKFFGFYAEGKKADNYYKEGLVQEINQQKKGLVQVCFCDKGETEATGEMASTEGNTTVFDLFSPEEAEALRGILTTQELTPEQLEVLFAVKDARRRGYRDGDIAVLFRGNDDCTGMANIMLALGWNVITPKSLLLDNSSYVNLIVYTIQCLLNPSDKVAQYAIQHSIQKLIPPQNSSSPNNTDVNNGEETSNWRKFNGHIKEHLGRELSFQWLSQPLYVLVQKIMSFYGMHKLSDPFLTGFESLVMDYTAKRNGEPADFLLWWQMLKDNEKMPSLTLPEGLDSIRINTIHKSKGLEYPVVILPYSESDRQNNKQFCFWERLDDRTVAYINLSKSDLPYSSYQPQFDQEELNRTMDTENLLYVAHTRARDMLYIITNRIKKDGNTYGDILSRFLEGNPTLFTRDPNEPNRYYAGDPDWKNPSDPPDPKNITVPTVTASDFSIDSIFRTMDIIKEDDPRTEGIVIHDFLSQLEKYPQDEQETEQVLEHVDARLKEHLRCFFRKIQSEEKWHELFFPVPGVKVFNEYNIIDKDGNEYRPDRIVFLDGKTVVVDYKTGEERDEHRSQVENYCQLLRDMGYPDVSGELLYF